MAPNSDDEERLKTKEILRAIGERLVLSGWAVRAVDSDRGVGVTLTEKGIKGMDNLFDAVKELDPHTMDERLFIGLFLHLCARDFLKPPPSDAV